MEHLKECVLSTRPWSFTAAVVPILVTAAVTEQISLTSVKLLQALAMGIFVQAGANLTNTYFDYSNGIDTKHNTGDYTLVEKKLKPETVAFMSWVCYAIGITLAYPTLMDLSTNKVNQTSLIVFATGLILAYFYTAKPVGLKYKALGDLTIFACFGPLLMQFTSLFLTGAMRNDLFLYSVPIGLYTEAILHANNARDIKADAKAGAVTLATLVGKELSYTFYVMLFVGSYAAALAIAIWHHWAVLATLITLPLTSGLLSSYKGNNMKELPEETAKAHLPFGLTMILGIVFSDKGLIAFL
jgi:1,4-dihydroxy-2-naphthoate octaprenyltransferase